MMSKYLLSTLGCKVNQYESQVIREVLESFGLRSAQQGETADIAVVNTCAVTANASRKSRQVIRRAARDGRTPVVVVGCGSTAEADRLRKLDGVAAVLGHDVDVCSELRNLLAHQWGTTTTRPPGDTGTAAKQEPLRPDVMRDDIPMKPANRQPGRDASTPRTKFHPRPIMSRGLPVVKENGSLVARIESFAGHQRAFLKVQDGCDAYCTYCIIPQLRPTPRSKPVETAVAEARALVRAGHREIIVTGIFLGAYGRDTAVRKRWSRLRPPLTILVEALARVQGLARLRLSSLEPGDIDQSLLDVLASHENCVPHLHLPLQSGSPAILRRMNRQYTREAFLEMMDRVRATLNRPAITTDIIVGFPGETEADFQASVELARSAEFCRIHAFPFSPRDNTAAARWQREFVDPAVVRDRMARLARLGMDLSLAFRRRFVGSVERVIVEEPSASGAQPPPGPERLAARPEPVAAGTGTEHYTARPPRSRAIRQGRADRYFEIHFEAEDVRPGDLVRVRIDRVTPTRTHGELLIPISRKSCD